MGIAYLEASFGRVAFLATRYFLFLLITGEIISYKNSNNNTCQGSAYSRPALFIEFNPLMLGAVPE
jgi:hypothetical protein